MDKRRNKDISLVPVERKCEKPEEKIIQGILTNQVATKDSYDFQIDLSEIVMDNNTDNCDEVISNSAIAIDSDSSKASHYVSITETQNEVIIDEHAKVAQQEETMSSQINCTNSHEETSDDIDIHIPEEDQVLDSEERCVTDPINIHPLSDITEAVEEEMLDNVNESNHVTRTQRIYTDTTHEEEQNQTTEHINNKYFDPPPDYEECIIMEYYKINGLECRGSQTAENVCFCSCHGDVARGSNLAFDGPGGSAINVDNASTHSQTHKQNMRVRCVSWCLMLSLVVAGVVFGIIAGVTYG